MRAVVLVGGFGTRLRPLTEDIPKPLLPVGQRPIIEHVVRSLAAGGVTEVVLALGFRPDAFRDAYPSGTCAGVPLRYAVEPEPLDTGGADRLRRPRRGHRRDVRRRERRRPHRPRRRCGCVELHRERGGEATLHLTPVEDPSSSGSWRPTRMGGCNASWRSRRGSRRPAG